MHYSVRFLHMWSLIFSCLFHASADYSKDTNVICWVLLSEPLETHQHNVCIIIWGILLRLTYFCYHVCFFRLAQSFLPFLLVSDFASLLGKGIVHHLCLEWPRDTHGSGKKLTCYINEMIFGGRRVIIPCFVPPLLVVKSM